MKLIVGLGNPGKEYTSTRHNVGFMVMDALADYWHVSINTKKFKGEYVKVKYQGEDVILLKPLTYMNNSGESVIQVMNYFKIDVDDLIYQSVTLNIPNPCVCDINCVGDSEIEKYIKKEVSDPRLDVFKAIKIKKEGK